MDFGVPNHPEPVHFGKNSHVDDVGDAHDFKFPYDVILGHPPQSTNEKGVLVSVVVVLQRQVELAFKTIYLLLLFLTTHRANLNYQFN